MAKVKYPELNANELTSEMRTAQPVTRPESDHTFRAATENNLPEPSSTIEMHELADNSGLVLEPAFATRGDDEYHVSSFLKFHDAEFVTAAYRAILKREPDPEAFQHCLQGLREQRFDRFSVILQLRDSEEGRRHNVRINGLTWPRLMRTVTAWPIIGYPIRVVLDLVRLPVVIWRLQESVALADARNQQIARHLNAIGRRTTEALNRLHAADQGTVESLNELQAADRRTRESLNELQAVDRRTTESMNDLSLAIATVRQSTEALADRHDALQKQTDTLAGELSSRLDSTMDAARNHAREIASHLTVIREQLSDSSRRSETHIEDLVKRVQTVRRELNLQHRTLAVLGEIAKRPSSIDDATRQSFAAEAEHQLDAFYVELEDIFRGSRNSVKESFEFYLPYIKSTSGEELPIVDLGCGRGEWLELLKEAGCKAVGVDTNRAMLDICRERDFEVKESDALAYLRSLSDRSLRAVTGFHIIEHLPTDTLVMLLDEVYRVLQPGGLAIFETPNPDNLFVGSNYFYHDPSHRNPLPGRLARFLLESRGFERVEVVPLHECAEGRFNETGEVSNRLNDLFYGPMDYAVVGWKLDR